MLRVGAGSEARYANTGIGCPRRAIAARGSGAYCQPMQPLGTAGPSRREFLGTSALGLLGMNRLTRFAPLPNEQELLYVGSYTDAKRTEGIALVRFDTRPGALEL